MIAKKAIAAALIAATALTAVPANAGGVSFQFGFGAPGYGWSHGPHHRPGWRHSRVSPHEVRRMLRRHGYYHIRFTDRRGAIYQLRANKRRHTFFLVVSARNGEILSRHRVRRGRW